MNYRHAFHAGNFADLVKHATLTTVIAALQRKPTPLSVIDTHAGAGIYDLVDPMPWRTREAEQGIVRLMADGAAPAVFDALKTAVRQLNPDRTLRYYPGSPLIVARHLRNGDRYTGCELRADDAAMLQQTLSSVPEASALQSDGYREALRPVSEGRGKFVLIDPPFERPDDYDRILETVRDVTAVDPAASLAVWLPLKDLETFDSFLWRLEDLEPGPFVVAQARLKPLREPLKMNGCAMVLVRPPSGLAPALEAICGWVAQNLGGAGAEGRVVAFGG